MINIADDPLIRHAERTGYAPWIGDDPIDYDDYDDADEPFAVYDPY